ncbi:unnamed protein product [Victoria cruziana]
MTIDTTNLSVGMSRRDVSISQLFREIDERNLI